MLFAVLNCSAQESEFKEYDYLVTIHTEYGKIKMILFDKTPVHKQNFINLALAGVYEDIVFHRVINHFMIQTGDPATRLSDENFNRQIIQKTLPAEISDQFVHDRSYIGAARRGNDKNPEKRSSGTQFYIIQGCRGAHHLDGEYTIFGKVMSGMEVVDKIAATETNEKDRPVEPIRLTIEVTEVLKSDLEKYYNYPIQ